MNRFLRKVLVFSIVFFLFDKVFYLFILISPSKEIDKRLQKILDGEINKDIIVLGSSRGARNIIAGQIEDSLGISTYNLSYPAADIEFQEFLLRSLIQFNETPKIVLLAIDVIDPEEFLPSEKIKFRLDRMYPLAIYQHVNNELIAREEKTILSKFLVLARINKRNFDLQKKQFTALDTILDCGSMPIYFQKENRAFIFDSTEQQYETVNELENKVNAFLNLQDICIKNEIKLFLIFSPNFSSHNLNFEKRLRLLTKKEVEYFIYDATNPIYKNKSYFYDETHLQTPGAIVFTNEIINFLKSKN